MDNVDKLFKWDLLLDKIVMQLTELQVKTVELYSDLEKACEEDDTATARDTATQLLMVEAERITLTDLRKWMTREAFPKPE